MTADEFMRIAALLGYGAHPDQDYAALRIYTGSHKDLWPVVGRVAFSAAVACETGDDVEALLRNPTEIRDDCEHCGSITFKRNDV